MANNSNKKGFNVKNKRIAKGIVAASAAGVIFLSGLGIYSWNNRNFRPTPDLDTESRPGYSQSGDIEQDIHTVAKEPSINTEVPGASYIETETYVEHFTGNEPTINTETESNMFITQVPTEDATEHEVQTEAQIGAGNSASTSQATESATETHTERVTETERETEQATETERETHPVTETETEYITETESSTGSSTRPTETEIQTEYVTEAPVSNATSEQIITKLTVIAKNYMKKVTGSSKDPNLTNLIISKITPDANSCQVLIEGRAYIKEQPYTVAFIMNTADNTLAIYKIVNKGNSLTRIDTQESLNAIDELIDFSYGNKFKLTSKIDEYSADAGLSQ